MRQCPACLSANDAETPVNGVDREPVAGDLCVCLYCATALTFTEDLQLRRVTDAELFALDSDTRLQLLKVVAAARLAHTRGLTESKH